MLEIFTNHLNILHIYLEFIHRHIQILFITLILFITAISENHTHVESEIYCRLLQNKSSKWSADGVVRTKTHDTAGSNWCEGTVLPYSPV